MHLYSLSNYNIPVSRLLSKNTWVQITWNIWKEWRVVISRLVDDKLNLICSWRIILMKGCLLIGVLLVFQMIISSGTAYEMIQNHF